MLQDTYINLYRLCKKEQHVPKSQKNVMIYKFKGNYNLGKKAELFLNMIACLSDGKIGY